MSTPSLHDRIMRIQSDFGAGAKSDSRRQAYLLGHRDARHAAAELALEADAVRDELVKALSGMVSVWRTVCSSKGWEPEHMSQYTAALAAIANATKEQK